MIKSILYYSSHRHCMIEAGCNRVVFVSVGLRSSADTPVHSSKRYLSLAPFLYKQNPCQTCWLSIQVIGSRFSYQIQISIAFKKRRLFGRLPMVAGLILTSFPFDRTIWHRSFTMAMRLLPLGAEVFKVHRHDKQRALKTSGNHINSPGTPAFFPQARRQATRPY